MIPNTFLKPKLYIEICIANSHRRHSSQYLFCQAAVTIWSLKNNNLIMSTNFVLDCHSSTIINLYHRVTKSSLSFYSPCIQLFSHFLTTNETYSIFRLLSITKSRARSEARDLTFLGHHLLHLLYFTMQVALNKPNFI